MQSKKRAKPVKFGTSVKDKDKIKKEAARIEKAAAVASAVDPREEEKEELSVTENTKGEETQQEGENEESLTEASAEEKPEDSKKEVEEPGSDEDGDESSDHAGKVDESEIAEEEVELEELNEEEKEANEEDAKETLANKDVAFFNVPPDAYDKKNSMLPYFFRVMLVTFVLGLVFFAGIYYAVSHKNDLMSFINRTSPTVTQAPVEITPTEEPVDLNAYSIRVLNGTSTSGLAAKVRDELNASGFNVISVGNADEDNYDKTEIEAVEKVQSAFLDKLKAELASSYEVGEVKSLSTGSADIIVTVGSASAR